MSFRDMLEQTFWFLSSNKVRSGLTMLGIVVGIGSVIAMISVGQGAQASIKDRITAIGSNLIIVMPGAQRSPGSISAGRGSAHTLTQADADAISSQISNVKVAPELDSRKQVAAKGNNTNTQIIGTVPAYTDVRNEAMDSGSFITGSEDRSSSKVAVLGPSARDDLFGTGADAVGQEIRIGSSMFKVIGVTASKGGSGFNNPDDAIYIPLGTMQHYLVGGSYVSSISVSAASQDAMPGVQQQLADLLLQRHRISNPAMADFSVMNQQDIISTASSVTQTLTLLLASIAGISLLVGGIGIMNMMLTTVTERTREIGLRKSVGAKKGDISMQFLSESVMLTFLGGAIGIVLGFAASLAISHLANMPTSFSYSSVILVFGVSALIGIVFGYYPARRAANLSPIVALRYE
ncbi:MAG: ABC transporter permease [Actinomycetota bacterium]|nr:ABC transporter permease [Actinomycetota bacterium]MCL6093122.1 ABC transporter permease [Actinomycetota bacterium]MDA8167805.1 ABC transporter permease [Actinomycetota bacterium]